MRHKNATINNRKYYESHRDEICARRNARRRERRNNPEFRKLEAKRQREQRARNPSVQLAVRNALNARLHKKLSSVAPKVSKTLDLLGCSMDYFLCYMERNFREGMSWANRGFHGWHIDHRIPCAAFDLTDPDQQRQCFHYSNLQPMWALENQSKGARY